MFAKPTISTLDFKEFIFRIICVNFSEEIISDAKETQDDRVPFLNTCHEDEGLKNVHH